MIFPKEDLKQFQRPSRYLGREINAVIKNEAEVNLRVALAFPDVYEIGMSHAGLKILYGLINREPEFWAERAMAPWLDGEDYLRRSVQPLRSLESGRPLADFDLIGFSLQYELSYTNVLNMLDLAGLPLSARDRGPDQPLVVGGGPCTVNPEPLAEFFDFFYLGDAEAGFIEILKETVRWKEQGGTKQELLVSLSRRPGVYVPSFFEPAYDSQGRMVGIDPLRPGYTRVRRAVAADLDPAYFPTETVVPFTKPVHDRLALEIARGCTQGCRFCQAGFIYRPVRERRPETVLKLAAKTLAATGQDEVSFLSLSAGDYTCLGPLMAGFMDTYAGKRIALSLPSLRAKSLNEEMMRQIKRVRKTGFTLAPEAGTQRLRDVINKDLTEEDLLVTARGAFDLGWRLVKLYFMIGLPTETRADVEAIVDLARRVRAGTRGRINVSFAAFVPKPHTPFQWEPMLDQARIHERMELLRYRLKGPGLRPKWNEAEASLLEGILARGDRRLGEVLRLVQSRGGRFDAWTEELDLKKWFQAMAEAGINPENYLRARDREEVLPWSHLQAGCDVNYLWSELERAYLGRKTPDCRFGSCSRCGVCDFEEIRPRLSDPERDRPQVSAPPAEEGRPVRMQVNYAKTGPARYLSHLETVDVFTRAVRRAGLNFETGRGFNPQPKISFATPLPVGVASLDEYVEFELLDPPEVQEVKEMLAGNLPAGLTVKEVSVIPNGQSRLQASGARYRMEAPVEAFDRDRWEFSRVEPHIWVTKNGKGGPKSVDLKPLLKELRVLTPESIEITLLFGPEGSIRPQEAARAVFDLPATVVEQSVVVKLETLVEVQKGCLPNLS